MRDRIFLWGRLFPALADVPDDTVGKPQNFHFVREFYFHASERKLIQTQTEDFIWAVVLLTSDVWLTLSCGSDTTISKPLSAGLSKVRLPLESDCYARAIVVRDGRAVVDFLPHGFHFQRSPPSYNFNAFVAMSP